MFYKCYHIFLVYVIMRVDMYFTIPVFRAHPYISFI